MISLYFDKIFRFLHFVPRSYFMLLFLPLFWYFWPFNIYWSIAQFRLLLDPILRIFPNQFLTSLRLVLPVMSIGFSLARLCLWYCTSTVLGSWSVFLTNTMDRLDVDTTNPARDHSIFEVPRVNIHRSWSLDCIFDT